jgi:hypothetical protein
MWLMKVIRQLFSIICGWHNHKRIVEDLEGLFTPTEFPMAVVSHIDNVLTYDLQERQWETLINGLNSHKSPGFGKIRKWMWIYIHWDNTFQAGMLYFLWFFYSINISVAPYRLPETCFEVLFFMLKFMNFAPSSVADNNTVYKYFHLFWAHSRAALFLPSLKTCGSHWHALTNEVCVWKRKEPSAHGCIEI